MIGTAAHFALLNVNVQGVRKMEINQIKNLLEKFIVFGDEQCKQWSRFLFTIAAGSYMGAATVFSLPDNFKQLHIVLKFGLIGCGMLFTYAGHKIVKGK
jgi:hypothetical protein